MNSQVPPPRSPAATTAATERVWRALHDRLLAFIRGRVRSPADAEDILQDVFVRIEARAGDLRDAGKLQAWVWRITRNAITDHYRSQARVGARAGRPEEVELAADPDVPAPDDDAARRELAGCLRPLIAGLAPHYREALELTALGDKTQREAAQRLEISVSGMKSRVQRGRDKLREALLACCAVELDSRRGVSDFTRRSCADPSCGGPSS